MSNAPTSAEPVMLIAGGSGSIGRAVAAEALDRGWCVALHGRRAESLSGVAAALNSERVKPLAVDIAERDGVERLIEQAAAWAGRLDAVVDCVSAGPAGARISGLFSQTDPAAYGAWLELSVAYQQRLAHAALPWLRRQGGTFIAFVSDAGRYAAPRQSVLGAARAATIGFVRNLAVEVARDAIRVHCVSPSFVADSDSARRLATQSADRMRRAAERAGLGLPTPADIAPMVVFLCGEGARRITGQIISINGGVNA
ncbi:MAG TPA: SDR family oxidoreductase [Steroidobacteraceae bacterium]|jgi:NAD(P)-dependent dehydrogenase (short-subunit alcohol dehydrogenase family)|nr:SDR family oxidoreductase [Steroidobacteraceae bacterium]